jgi:hypothetical protein
MENELSERLEAELARLRVLPLQTYLDRAQQQGAGRRVFKAGTAVVATVLLFATALVVGQLLTRARDLVPARPGASSEVEVRHASGLLLLGPLDRTAIRPLPTPLAKALNDAQALARSNPDLFGYPYADRRSGELVLSAVGAAGQALGQRWTPEGGEARAVPRRIRLVDRSYGELERVRHEAIGPGAAGLPDADLIWMTAQGDEINRVIVVISRMSDPLLFALASRYGSELVAVRVEPAPR